jgi:hypothetical protein
MRFYISPHSVIVGNVFAVETGMKSIHFSVKNHGYRELCNVFFRLLGQFSAPASENKYSCRCFHKLPSYIKSNQSQPEWNRYIFTEKVMGTETSTIVFSTFFSSFSRFWANVQLQLVQIGTVIDVFMQCHNRWSRLNRNRNEIDTYYGSRHVFFLAWLTKCLGFLSSK